MAMSPAYTKPLSSKAPKELLLDQGHSDLPQVSLMEHFERAFPLLNSPSYPPPLCDITHGDEDSKLGGCLI